MTSSPDNETRMRRALDELRDNAPAAPERLRARIDALAATEPARRRALHERVSLRRALLLLAPAMLVLALGTAVIGAISGAADEGADEAVVRPDAARAPREVVERSRPNGAVGPVGQSSTYESARAAGGGAAADQRLRGPTTGLPPAGARAQDYRVSLRLRVDGLDDLSRRTKEAIRLTRRWGGYVVAADYDVPGSHGDSRLELRVPVRHVQAAVQRFSELGTILAQDIAIRDVQRRLDRYTRELLALREQIAELRADLRRPGSSPRQRARLELRLARARQALTELSGARAALARRTAFAAITLTLTTRNAATVPADDEGRLERAVEDAGAILVKELAFALYAIIVAAPFLVLAAAAYFVSRAGRRRADERLLEAA